MKLLTILVIFVSWTIAKGAIQSDLAGTPIVSFPVFETPTFDFIDLSGGCGGFTDCLEYIGAVIYNIGLGLIFLVLFLIELIQYIIAFFALIIQIQFTGIPNAPYVVNVLLTTPFLATVALIIYNATRRGKTASD